MADQQQPAVTASDINNVFSIIVEFVEKCIQTPQSELIRQAAEYIRINLYVTAGDRYAFFLSTMLQKSALSLFHNIFIITIVMITTYLYYNL